MNTFLKYILFSFLFVLSSCSGEDVFVANGQSPRDALVLTVSAGDFVTDGNTVTRAADDGATTTFENDNKVGVIILDDEGNLLSNNVPYKYNDGIWAFDDSEGKPQCYYDNQAKTYIVYYPYSTTADDVTDEAVLKSKFAPKEDQSKEDDYRASDLLVWTSTSGPLKTLTAELKHAYASVSVSPNIKYTLQDGNSTEVICALSQISDVSLAIEDNSAYKFYPAEDGSYRYILPTDFSSGDASCTLTFNEKKYSSTMTFSTSVSANTRYTFVPIVIGGVYGLDKVQIGDFYCKDSKDEGYLIPGDILSLTDAQQEACIGIVYSTDASRIGTAATEALKKNGVTSPHGLVMALTSASDNALWGPYRTDENSGGSEGEPFKANTDQVNKMYANVDGYGETHWIIENHSDVLQNKYAAFYYASLYGTNGTEKYAAPSNTTTGWFIPSIGQWWDIMSNLCKIDLADKQEDTDPYPTLDDLSKTAVANMKKYLQKISSATFSLGNYFWSSSEYSNIRACYVGFGSYGGFLYLNYCNKDTDGRGVRCIFAF